MPLLSRAQPKASRTFQEVMEQQAARQAGFSDAIPLRHFLSSSQSTDHVDRLPSPHRANTSPQPTTYHHPIRAPYPSAAAGTRSAMHLPLPTSIDQSRSSISDSSESGSSSRKGSTNPSSTSSGSILTQPTTPTSSHHAWSNPVWDPEEYNSSPLSGAVPETNKKGGIKGWLKKRGSKEKAIGKVKKVAIPDGAKREKVKEEKPVFVGGGRGGAQNRPVRPEPTTKTTSHLDSIPETLAPIPTPTPLVTFTSDIQEALENLAPKPKAVFVGGGRGGMQNRKIKEALAGSGASGSWKSGSGTKGSASVSDTSSTRRSIMSMGSSVRDGASTEASRQESKRRFVGGGRGGAQNRKQKDMAGGGLLKRKQSKAGLGTADLMTGIGVSSYTVTSSMGDSVRSQKL